MVAFVGVVEVNERRLAVVKQKHRSSSSLHQPPITQSYVLKASSKPSLIHSEVLPLSSKLEIVRSGVA